MCYAFNLEYMEKLLTAYLKGEKKKKPFRNKLDGMVNVCIILIFFNYINDYKRKCYFIFLYCVEVDLYNCTVFNVLSLIIQYFIAHFILKVICSVCICNFNYYKMIDLIVF